MNRSPEYHVSYDVFWYCSFLGICIHKPDFCWFCSMVSKHIPLHQRISLTPTPVHWVVHPFSSYECLIHSDKPSGPFCKSLFFHLRNLSKWHHCPLYWPNRILGALCSLRLCIYCINKKKIQKDVACLLSCAPYLTGFNYIYRHQKEVTFIVNHLIITFSNAHHCLLKLELIGSQFSSEWWTTVSISFYRMFFISM